MRRRAWSRIGVSNAFRSPDERHCHAQPHAALLGRECNPECKHERNQTREAPRKTCDDNPGPLGPAKAIAVHAATKAGKPKPILLPTVISEPNMPRSNLCVIPSGITPDVSMFSSLSRHVSSDRFGGISPVRGRLSVRFSVTPFPIFPADRHGKISAAQELRRIRIRRHRSRAGGCTGSRFRRTTRKTNRRDSGQARSCGIGRIRPPADPG